MGTTEKKIRNRSHKYEINLQIKKLVKSPQNKMEKGAVLAPSLFTLKGLLILDNHGRRILAHYYDPETLTTRQEQSSFERKLFRKTSKTNVEVLLHEGFPIVYKPSVDLYFYVIGASGENELMLQSVLQCLFDSLNILLRKDVEKKTVFQNLGTVMLTIDEICDGGIIMEHDPCKVASRVTVRSEDLPLGEQTVSQVLQNYKEQLKMSLLR